MLTCGDGRAEWVEFEACSSPKGAVRRARPAAVCIGRCVESTDLHCWCPPENVTMRDRKVEWVELEVWSCPSRLRLDYS